MKHFVELNGMQDFASEGSKPEVGTGGRSSRTAGNEGWYGATWQGAVDFVRTGWAKGTATARAFLDELQQVLPPMQKHTEMYLDEAPGCFLDMDTYLEGEPEHWVGFQEEVKQPLPVRIAVAASASCGTPTDHMINRGCAIAAIIDILEGRGYQCQVDVIFAIKSHGPDRYELKVTVKDTDQPLDLDALVFALAHPSSLRRLAFAVMERAPQEVRNKFGFKNVGGYGYPTDASLDTRSNYDLYMNYLAHGSSQFSSAQSTHQWVLAVLKSQGYIEGQADAPRGLND